MELAGWSNGGRVGLTDQTVVLIKLGEQASVQHPGLDSALHSSLSPRSGISVLHDATPTYL